MTAASPIPDLDHQQALDAICGCAATVTVLSYEEAIGAYFKLRGLGDPASALPLSDTGKINLSTGVDTLRAKIAMGERGSECKL